MVFNRFRRVILVSLSVLTILVLYACQLAQTVSALIATDTPTPTMTFTPTFTATPTMTATATATATFTPTATFTLTPLPTNTPAPTQKAVDVSYSSEGGCNGGNSAFEAQVVGLINQERASAGVAALKANGALTSAARAHSKDMAVNNYFSHGSDFAGRLSSAGYSFSAAAENIYAGQGKYDTPYSAVSSWMGSSGHRTNMLNSTYTEIGVGYWCNTNSSYEGYFTADFGRP